MVRVLATSKIDIPLPGRGLEPLRISPPDPKSGASANFATLAHSVVAPKIGVVPAFVLEPIQPRSNARLTLVRGHIPHFGREWCFFARSAAILVCTSSTDRCGSV